MTDAIEIIKEVSEHPTLDELLRRLPSKMTREDRTVLVQRERERRAAAFARKEARAEAKEAEDEQREEE